MTNITLDLNYEGFERGFFMSAGNDITQWREYYFRFENNYGAQVSKKSGCVGYENDLWDLETVCYIGNNEDPYDDKICFIAGQGYYAVTDEQVRGILAEIKKRDMHVNISRKENQI